MSSPQWIAANPAKYRAMRKQMHSNRKDRNTKWIADYKTAHPCACGETDIACLEFHHRDSKTKEFGLGSRGKVGLAKIQRELLKCEVICANCHRKGHAGRPHTLHAAFFAEGIDWHAQ